MTEGEARFIKEYSRDNRWGIASIGGRLGVCMGVVKIDSCEPDWDVHAVQHGCRYVLYSNVNKPEEWGA